MIEDEITTRVNPWDDPDFLSGLDRRLAEYEGGNVEMATWEEVKAKAHTLPVGSREKTQKIAYRLLSLRLLLL